MINGLELRHLRYFIALAGELHFGRAAEALRVTQPLLSRQVRELERLVGVPLLARTRPVVELTAAGEQFFLEAQQTLRQAERAVRAAHRAGGEPDRLVVAFEPCSVFHGFARLAGNLKHTFPDLHLDILEFPVAEHINRLRSGEIDIAYAHRNEDAEDIEFTSMGWEPLLAVLPSGHPAARCRKLTLKLLVEEPFVFWHRALAPACHDYILKMLRAGGVEPRIAHRVSDHRRSLEMVAANLGWTIAPACARRAGQKGLAFRSIDETVARVELGISHLRSIGGRKMSSVVRIWQASVQA